MRWRRREGKGGGYSLLSLKWCRGGCVQLSHFVNAARIQNRFLVQINKRSKDVTQGVGEGHVSKKIT